jgi:hypothetical protein
MNVKKIVILNFFILYSLNLSAQKYLDPANYLATLSESNRAKTYANELKKTTPVMRKLIPTVTLERSNLVTVDIPLTYINFNEYLRSCKKFFSPISKNKCIEKLDFLEEAFKKTNLVLESYHIKPFNLYRLKTNAGLEQQIRLKYISIIMNIQFELDNIKEQSTKRFGFESVIKN